YLQTDSPFPVRTRLQLLMRVGDLKLQIEGLVRVMHPSAGMGVEFLQRTMPQQKRVQEFIHTLVHTTGAVPELQVRPDTIDNAAASVSIPQAGINDDPLLLLFQTGADLPLGQFQLELRKQRGVEEVDEEVLSV